MSEHSENPEEYGKVYKVPSFRAGPKRVVVTVFDDDSRDAFEFKAELTRMEIRQEPLDVTDRFESPWRTLLAVASTLELTMVSRGEVSYTRYEEPKKEKKRGSRKLAGKSKRGRGKAR